jgi:DNA-binding Xre family transcriptional regulator
MSNKSKIIANFINMYMFEKSYNTTELAKHTGIPQPTLFRIVNEKVKRINTDTRNKLLSYFGESIKSILFDNGSFNNGNLPAINGQKIQVFDSIMKNQIGEVLGAFDNVNDYFAVQTDESLTHGIDIRASDTIIIKRIDNSCHDSHLGNRLLLLRYMDQNIFCKSIYDENLYFKNDVFENKFLEYRLDDQNIEILGYVIEIRKKIDV